MEDVGRTHRRARFRCRALSAERQIRRSCRDGSGAAHSRAILDVPYAKNEQETRARADRQAMRAGKRLPGTARSRRDRGRASSRGGRTFRCLRRITIGVQRRVKLAAKRLT